MYTQFFTLSTGLFTTIINNFGEFLKILLRKYQSSNFLVTRCFGYLL